jgi:steroid 5-alpha reductase family enzyme
MVRRIVVLVIALIAALYISLKVNPLPLDAMQLHTLEVSAIIMGIVALLCWLLAEASGNYSQVDKIWSIIPVVYVVYFAWASDSSPRNLLMAVCAGIWGVRLTYNFARKGGYRLKFWTGEEDYRWDVLRESPAFKDKPLNWKLFSFFFIAVYQNILLWLITLPALMAYAGMNKPLGIADYVLAAVYILLVVIETIADQQQWNYQNEKYRLKHAGIKPEGEYAIGFIRSGLFKYLRHPNYAAEQSIWVVFYLFSIVATGMYVNWSVTGCILLMILFQGSANFSEGISMSKYPEYIAYKKKVGSFVPKVAADD